MPSTKELLINHKESVQEFIRRHSIQLNEVIHSSYCDKGGLYRELKTRMLLGIEIVHFLNEGSPRVVSLIRHSSEGPKYVDPVSEDEAYQEFKWKLKNMSKDTPDRDAFLPFSFLEEEYILIIGPSLSSNEVKHLTEILTTGDKEYKILQYTQTIDSSIPIAQHI